MECNGNFKKLCRLSFSRLSLFSAKNHYRHALDTLSSVRLASCLPVVIFHAKQVINERAVIEHRFADKICKKELHLHNYR